MGNFTRYKKIVILIIAVLITTTIGIKIFTDDDKKDIQIEENGLFLEENKESVQKDYDKEQENELFAEQSSDVKNEQEEIQTHVVVHITGEVANPGVVTLKNGDRVIDAIKKAGGLLSEADESRINLAQKLFDEDKVLIPKIGEGLEVEAGEIQSTDSTNDNSNNMVISKNNENNNNSTSSSSSGVNINTASKEDLKTLPGIGDVTSQKIIDYRETEKFNTIEDIKNVSGIGDKKFEAIKSMITTK